MYGICLCTHPVPAEVWVVQVGGYMYVHMHGYLVHEKQRPPRVLQYACAWDPMVAIERGLIIISEVPL